ncbi:Carbohydrate family 9 binding domain-like [Chitinophaga niabensis]|uniref:Carbohydrate family 9 binding domain-like n=2 Tax=Chitinophaga niabensis TaxID=536979 RepID=A0A1N6DBZ3_9BACT|nr:Carbohydrate family 9 binding domain-like [Chitinophaga niabensis]
MCGLMNLILTGVLLAACGNSEVNGPADSVRSLPFIPGARIAWDHSTLQQVSDPASPNNYNGYARIKQLQDNSLIVIYESGGSIMSRKSTDEGKTWGNTVIVAEKPPGINMAVPDLLELKDGSLLAMYNPRPHAIDPSRKFGIRIKKSYDKGNTWKDEQLLYEAGYQFENGCWEPAAVQLPNGEIQLFFANEGIYTSSSEQNISMLRSTDNGATWSSDPQIVSFRPGSRDGMPVPLLLKGKSTVVFAIEDNGFTTFKPYTIRNTFSENWASTVGASGSNRSYALKDKLNDHIYAGAPYIAQLNTGETILSYQAHATDGRTEPNAVMMVAVGDENATGFNRVTEPFVIPVNRSGQWNSVCVLKDNSVIAVTSTRAFSTSGRTEVWMIRGHIINGNTIFVGRQTNSQVNAGITHDNERLRFLAKVKDQHVIDNEDGVTFFIDAQNKSYEKPHTGIFSVSVSASGNVVVKEGKNGSWIALPDTKGVQAVSRKGPDGYTLEVSVPWLMLGGKPGAGARMGINIQLNETETAGQAPIKEDATGCNANEPFSWLSEKL